MTWPAPQPGLVIRFSYLWKREADAGREDGVKDRPCAIIVAVAGDQGRPRVVVVPVTHSPPQPADEGIELPQQTSRRLGLDDERSWVIISEANEFTWPGPDLRFVPGKDPESATYGILPPAVFRVIRDRFLARYPRRNLHLVPRTE